METAAIVERWPGVRPIVRAITAKVTSVGLILDFGNEDTVDRLPDFWQVAEFGVEFLSMLRVEGLEEEIASRG